MNTNKFTRRSFIRSSLFLSGITLIFPRIKPPVSTDEEEKEYLYDSINSFPVSPDIERIAALLKKKDPLIWLFTGDSITHGAKHTGGYRSYPEIFGERIRWEMGRVRDIVINTGISGNTAQSIIHDFDWRVKQFRPSVVSLMIGTNDCAESKNISREVFRQNLVILLTMIRDLGSVPVLHTPNVIIQAKAPERARLPEYVDVIRDIAGKLQLILVDNYGYWQNAIKEMGEKNLFGKWLNDPLHPNGAGHSEIARLMFRELSIFDPQAATCGGPYYEGEH
jgi:acyl-CoA thioesterase I